MANINNNYKRFQTYTGDVKQNTFKQDFMEQNYQISKKQFGETKSIGEKKELKKADTSFIERTTRIGVNREGQFFKK